MSRRYSSLLIRRLHGAVHWLIDAKQAGAEPAPALVGLFDVEAARAELEDLLQRLHRAAEAAGAGERAVQLCAARFRLARHFDAGKILARGDLQIRKRLVVFEVAVELRLDVLDQSRFGEQGIDLAVAVQVIDVADLFDQVRGAAFVGRGLEEVAGRARAEVLGLADVDHAAGAVLHQVHARGRRKVADFVRGVAEAARLG